MKKNFPNTRLRRLRLTKSIRNLIRENSLSPCDLIQPIFLIEGKSKIEKIKTMPDIFRFTIDKAIIEIKKLKNLVNKLLILNFSDIFNNTLSWSSFLLVGSFIRELKSSLLDINWIIDKESFSISLIELLSSASSYSAKEYLPTDVSEKPLLLLNLYPLLIIEDLLKFEFN